MPKGRFGDNTAGTFVRGGVIPAGGLRVETGCYTHCDGTDLVLPSNFLEVISVVVNGDGTLQVIAIPDMSGTNIKASTSGTCSGKVINYVAVGW
jgi:hypothetical protein